MHPKITVTPQSWAPRGCGCGGLHLSAVPTVGLHPLGKVDPFPGQPHGMSLRAGQVGGPEHNRGTWQCPSHLSLCPGGSGCD